MKTPTVTAPPRLKSAAVKALTRFDQAYHQNHGLAELEQEVEQRREGLASHIYGLALSARKSAGSIANAIVVFSEACGYAEDKFKAEHDVANLSKRVPAWPQFKSRILRAMKAGIDPQDYRSERMLREALADAQSAALVPGQQGIKPLELVRQTGMHTSFHRIMSRLVSEVIVIRPAKRDDAVEILKTATQDLLALVDKRRAPDSLMERIDARREAA